VSKFISGALFLVGVVFFLIVVVKFAFFLWRVPMP
jgi:hypothetical protein